MKGREIVKALECCRDCNCRECPACRIIDGGIHCTEIDEEEILDFINRLKAERNKYKIKAQNQKGHLAGLNKQVAKQKAEIKKLNDLFDSSQDNSFNAIHLLYEMREKFNRQKVELDKKDTEIDILIRKKEALRDENSELKAEVERLRNTVKTDFLTVREKLKISQSDIVEIRAEAIEEFLKKLEDESIESLVCLGYGEKELQNIVEFETVKRIAKEMTEVEK